MIPNSVTAVHVHTAIRVIDRDGVPRSRSSRVYDLVFEGQRYPPKYVLALAIKAATGMAPTSEEFGGGDETNGFLQGLGFTIVAKVAGVPDQPARVQQTVRSSAGSPVRVAVFSLRHGTQETEHAALADALAAARIAWESELLVLLPGYGKFWHRDVQNVTRLAERHKAQLLFESSTEGTPKFMGFDLTSTLHISPHTQVFATSGDANKNPSKVTRLLDACEPGGGRRFYLAGLDIGLLVCGENNLLVNLQAEGNRCAGVRAHPGRNLFTDAAIIHNGAHTIMGNWSKLNARFEWLSKEGRLVTYATNNDKPQSPWRRAVRVYFDGQRIADGEDGGTADKIEVVVIRDPLDQFRGLVTHLPVL